MKKDKTFHIPKWQYESALEIVRLYQIQQAEMELQLRLVSDQELAKPLSSLDLSTRAFNGICAYLGVFGNDNRKLVTIGDAMMVPIKELLRLRNVGLRTAKEIEYVLGNISKPPQSDQL